MKKIILLSIIIVTCSCSENFLDIKADSALIIPSSLEDLQTLLDNSATMNSGSPNELSVIGSDEYFVSNDVWNFHPNHYQKNAYVWADDIYEGDLGTDWSYAYAKILYCNTVLDGLKKIEKTDSNLELYDGVEGTALFVRAYTFYQLSQVFCKRYNKESAKTDLGIPLKVTADLEGKTYRATLEEVYQKVMEDLDTAYDKLPLVPVVVQRPSKIAVDYLKARIYLQVDEYEKALLHAEKVLKDRSYVTDYAEVDAELRLPFPANTNLNKEVIYHSWMQYAGILGPSNLQIDSELFSMYSEEDYRRSIFFFKNGSILTYKGSYHGSLNFFTGFTTPEMYLVKAECMQRLGRSNEAQKALDVLLKNRVANYKSVNLDGKNLLRKIIEERRKELIFRGVRWEDLRRLNQDPDFRKTLIRSINDKEYRLVPGDPRYVWPIPDEVIRISGIEQNVRK